jgi:gliding motility-associated-like protein
MRFLPSFLAFSFIFLKSFMFYGQTVTMTNTSVSQCSGNLLDPGGNANYGNNSLVTTTICPLVAGASSRLNFTFFDVELNFDNLTIYDGNTILAPVIGVFSGNLAPFFVQANNPSGCLTLVFSSDATNNGLGFNAEISCALPCQPVVAQLTSSTPAVNGGFIDICLGTSVAVNGAGSYPGGVPVYPQSDATSTFEWNFGDLGSSTVQNTSHIYNTVGVFDLNLMVKDINGCASTNDINVKVRVSNLPNFAGTSPVNSSICLGQTNDITGLATPTEISHFCASESAETVVIPDGIGVPYTSTLTLNCFDPTATITSASDLSSICVSMEHSYLHDLEITLACPNGNSISLYNALPGAVNSVYLGQPVDNDLSATLGTPYTYCFNMAAANTIYAVAEGFAGPVPTYNYIDNDGTSVVNAMYIPAGDYLPSDAFANLIGCPINGDWIVTITDQLTSDNGVVFDVSLNFNPSLYSTAYNYTPTISTSWNPDPTITNITGNTITVTPILAGTSCYTFTADDEFGCSFDTIVCFEVYPSEDATFTYGQTNFCTSAPNPVATVTGTLGGVFNATNGLAINPLTGSFALSSSLPGTYDISYTTPGNSCPSTSTVTITILEAVSNFSVNQSTGCAPLSVTFNNLTFGSTNCVWNFGDGTNASGCGTQTHVYNSGGNFSPSLTITDANGCSATLTQSNLIAADEKPIAYFLPNPAAVSPNDPTTVLNNFSTGATAYLWIFADNSTSNATSPVITVDLQEGEEFLVKLIAYSAVGCVDSTESYITLSPDLIFYIPNAFTPNNDEFNRDFMPVMSQGFKRDSYNFRIFDRWGEMIFQSKNPEIGWDGTFKNTGKIMQDGIYTYQLDFLVNKGDERKSFQGHVSLLR